MPEAILLKDVDGVGSRGAVVDVSKGYLRNFLIPRKLAAPASKGLLREAGLEDRVTRRVMDFAEATGEVEAAGIVIMNRVICCFVVLRCSASLPRDIRQVNELTRFVAHDPRVVAGINDPDVAGSEFHLAAVPHPHTETSLQEKLDVVDLADFRSDDRRGRIIAAAALRMTLMI